MIPSMILLALAASAPAGFHSSDPCLRPQRAGTTIQGDVRICPGRYRIPDPTEVGVLVIATSGTRLDLTGVILESGDTVASAFVGRGVVARNVDSVSIHGGRIRGYRFGIWIEGGRGHRVDASDLSGSRRQALRSTPSAYNEADWLDIFHPDSFTPYGGAVELRRTLGATVRRVVAHDGQNGIGLFDSREAMVADNDVSRNSGWGIHLWHSSRNIILRNQAHHNVRCESPAYSRGCDSAGLLLRQHSDSNLVSGNDLTWSGDGFFLSGQRGVVDPSMGNLVARNDGSFAYHNAFESTFSAENVFLENRADSSDYGFWLGYSRGNRVERNSVAGSRHDGIAIEHGGRNVLSGNTIIGGAAGIHLFAPHDGDDASADYRVDDNTIARAGKGIVLSRTRRARLRGNVLDELEISLVADSAASDAEVVGNVFLRAAEWFIEAPVLDAGGNYWAARGVDSTAARVRGKINLLPWRPASAAGF